MTVRTTPQEYLKEEQKIEYPTKTIYEPIPSDDFSKLILLGIVATVCVSGI